MKRMTALLLAAVMFLSLLPVLAPEAEAAPVGRLIALTFDDGPSGRYTGELLDGLKERGVSATFFVLGEMASYNRRLVRRAYQEGHEIGCHTYSHQDLTKLTAEEITLELQTAYAELDRACGAGTEYLVRPPYGNVNDLVRETVDVPMIHWSLDSKDWSLLDSEKVRDKIVDEVYDGCIILCHDIHKTSIPAALEAIDLLLEEGYEFVTVSELFRRRERELETGKLYYLSRKNGKDTGPIPAPELHFTGDADGVNTVTITCADKNVPLYYTLDGSYPNQEATLYTGPFTVPYGTTVTAVAAYKLNGSRSELTAAEARAIELVPPVITSAGHDMVAMETPTADCDIYYTVDGSPADENGIYYSGGAEYVGGPLTIRAVAVHETGCSAESVAYMGSEGSLFYDIHDGQWFFEDVQWAYEMGYLNGVAPYTMDPGGVLTRGMLVTMLSRFIYLYEEEDWVQTHTFADVQRDAYYAQPIEWAYSSGIVEGYSATQFGPNDPVTRQQMCKIVAAFLDWMEMPLSDGTGAAEHFEDYSRIAPWALESVERMVSDGLIQGDGIRLDPNGSANRAQFCVLLLRLKFYMEDYWADEDPVHHHSWKINYTDVSLNVGERFRLSVYCCGEGCDAVADSEWVASNPGVVSINGRYITGKKAGGTTTLTTEWLGDTYQCVVRVRSGRNGIEEPLLPGLLEIPEI